MKVSEIILESDLDEGWKEWMAAAGVAGGLALGGVGPKTQDVSYNITPDQSGVQTLKTLPQAQSTVTAPSQTQTQLPSSPSELKTYLVNHAQDLGMSGPELQHFVAQMSHETRNFTSMIERGTPEYFTNRYEKNPNKAKILGNKVKGDGERFKGRGYIQLTGRDNYTRAGKALGIDLVSDPDLAARPDVAAKVAVWYWKNRVAPKVGDFNKASVKQVTKTINPKLKGLKHRQTQMAKVQTPEEAAGVGVIAKASQKNDPRYSTSLTVDIKPDTPAKNMKALKLI